MRETAIPALADLVEAARRADGERDEDYAAAWLRPLLTHADWLDRLAAQAVERLAADPLHLFGLTALSSGPLQQLLLFSGARVSVTLGLLVQRAGDGAPVPTSFAFPGHRSLLRLLSDAPLPGHLAILTRRSGICRARAVSVPQGAVLDLDEARRSLWIAPPARQALFLRARIRRQPAPLVVSYRVGERSPRSRANGDDGLARSLAMTAMLRSLGARPPVDALRALLPRAQGRLRWTIMREMLASDVTEAWPELVRMAEKELDPRVRSAAASLRDRLLATAAQPKEAAV